LGKNDKIGGLKMARVQCFTVATFVPFLTGLIKEPNHLNALRAGHFLSFHSGNFIVIFSNKWDSLLSNAFDVTKNY
jgi:hypothetical protein